MARIMRLVGEVRPMQYTARGLLTNVIFFESTILQVPETIMQVNGQKQA